MLFITCSLFLAGDFLGSLIKEGLNIKANFLVMGT